MSEVGPLSGVCVLEIGSMISVPYAAMLLAEQGADVIKIEPPGGDQARHSSPQWRGMAAYFYNLNRGKRSVVLDLKSEAGQSAIRQLLRRADVVMENWRPGVARSLGLDWAALRAEHPRLITVSVRGYAETGPYAHDRVYDPIVQGVSAMASSQGGPETPALVRTYLPDKLASLGAAHGVLAALLQRERTGNGTHVALSMLDASVSFLWPDAMLYHTFAEAPKDPVLIARPGPRVAHLIQSGDGRWVVFTAVTEAQWTALCGAMGREDLAERYPDPQDRKRFNVEISVALTEGCTDLGRDEILARLRKADVPCGPVNTVDQMLSDPQVISNQTVRRQFRPGLGEVLEPRSWVAVGEERVATLRPAPRLGEHTVEVLSEAGISDSLAER